jgi:hypothetical protein
MTTFQSQELLANQITGPSLMICLTYIVPSVIEYQFPALQSLHASGPDSYNLFRYLKHRDQVTGAWKDESWKIGLVHIYKLTRSTGQRWKMVVARKSRLLIRSSSRHSPAWYRGPLLTKSVCSFAILLCLPTGSTYLAHYVVNCAALDLTSSCSSLSVPRADQSTMLTFPLSKSDYFSDG